MNKVIMIIITTQKIKFSFNPFMTEADIIFLYDIGLRHERIKDFPSKCD